GVYATEKADDPLGRVLNAYRLANQTRELRERLHTAIRNKDEDDLDGIALLMGHEREALVNWAATNNIISAEERAPLLEALTALYDVIRVDAFDAGAIRALAANVKDSYRVVERN